MSVCPWCRAAPFDPHAPCRSCGRRANASAAAVPDLDFAPASSAGRAAPPASVRTVAPVPPPPPSSQQDVQLGARGAVFEDEDDAFGSDLPLELDVKPDAKGVSPALRALSAQPSRAPVRQGTPAAGESPAMHLAPAHTPVVPPPNAAQSFRPLPAGVAERRSSAPPVEAFEAKVLANFGEPPKHFWQAPLYAWRVRQRLIELRGDLDARRKQAERAAAALEQGLVALGQRARSTAEKSPQYGRTLDGIRLHEQTLRQRDGALMTEMDGHNKKLAMVDQKIAELQAQLSAAQAEERRIADELTMAQATIQRAEAKLKRLDIELRSALGPSDPRRGGA